MLQHPKREEAERAGFSLDDPLKQTPFPERRDPFNYDTNLYLHPQAEEKGGLFTVPDRPDVMTRTFPYRHETARQPTTELLELIKSHETHLAFFASRGIAIPRHISAIGHNDDVQGAKTIHQVVETLEGEILDIKNPAHRPHILHTLNVNLNYMHWAYRTKQPYLFWDLDGPTQFALARSLGSSSPLRLTVVDTEPHGEAYGSDGYKAWGERAIKNMTATASYLGEDASTRAILKRCNYLERAFEYGRRPTIVSAWQHGFEAPHYLKSFTDYRAAPTHATSKQK